MPQLEIKKDSNGRDLYFINGTRVNIDTYNHAIKQNEEKGETTIKRP